MRVMVINTRPGDFRAAEVENSLGALRDIIGGEFVTETPAPLACMGLELITRRDGLLAGLETNTNLWPFFYVGTAVVLGDSPEGLTDGQLAFLYRWLAGLADE